LVHKAGAALATPYNKEGGGRKRKRKEEKKEREMNYGDCEQCILFPYY